MPQKSLAWKLSSDINEQKTLFSEISLPYGVDFYGCACGHVEHIIHDNTHETAHICQECGNEEFLDANTFLGNSVWYQPVENLFDEEYLEGLVPSVALDLKERKMYAKFFIPIPFRGDISKNRLEYKEQIIFEVKTDDEGEARENSLVRFIFDTPKHPWWEEQEQETYTENGLILLCKKKILSSLLLNPLDIANQSDIKDLKEFAFFLKYPHLKEYQFVNWHNPYFLPKNADLTVQSALEYILGNRGEKSLKKALYRSYTSSITKKEQFNFLYARAVVKNIEDVNIAARMLSLSIPKFTDSDLNETEIDEFMQFLYTHYSYKQIANLFKEYQELDPFFLKDTLALYSVIKNDLGPIIYIKCKVLALHDEFTIMHRANIEMRDLKANFFYSTAALRARESNENYEVKLPINGLELFDWSQKLQNCLASYDRQIIEQGSLIYGFFVDGEIKFALEISDGKLIQASAKYNRALTNAQKDVVAAWHKRYFL